MTADQITKPDRSLQPWLFALPLVAALGMIVKLYGDTFHEWWVEWTSAGSFYAHAMFVPFFVAIMVWRNRERLAAADWKPSWIGAGALVVGMLLFLVGERLDVTAVKSFSFLFVLTGGCLMLLGKPRTRVLLFPLVFVLMMMPLIPDQIINGIAFPIQLKSAHLATFLLNLFQLHSVCKGTMIQMDNYQMAVELPCSGFKTLVSLMTFTAAFSYLVEAATWKRWALFLTTIPLSLFINSLRITFIGMVGELVSKQAAAVFHDWSGFIVLTLAFLFLFNFARILRCERFLNIPLTDEEEKREKEEAAKNGTEVNDTPWWQELLTWRLTAAHLRTAFRYILVFDLIVGTTLAMAGSIGRLALRPRPPIATSQVPFDFTYDGVSYHAATNAQDANVNRLSKEAAETLSPTRIIQRIYSGTDGSVLTLFMTSGNGRKTFHDPHACSLGSDAELRDIGTPDIQTPIGTIKVQESIFQKAGEPDEFQMMFCYVVEGKLLQDKEQIRKAILRQMIFGDSGRPSYFVRVVGYRPGTDPEDRQKMVHFISGLWNEIGPILVGQKEGIPDNSPMIAPEPPK